MKVRRDFSSGLMCFVSCCQGSSQQMSNRRPDHGSRASLEREGDRGPRGGRPGSVVAPSKGLRAVFAPLVDYGDDSDEEEEPASPGDIHLLNPSVVVFACWLACLLTALILHACVYYGFIHPSSIRFMDLVYCAMSQMSLNQHRKCWIYKVEWAPMSGPGIASQLAARVAVTETNSGVFVCLCNPPKNKYENKGRCQCDWPRNSIIMAIMPVMPSVMPNISHLQLPLGLTRSCLQAKA